MTAPKGLRRLVTSSKVPQDTTLGWSETSRWCSSTSRAWSITQNKANKNSLSVVRPLPGRPELPGPSSANELGVARSAKGLGLHAVRSGRAERVSYGQGCSDRGLLAFKCYSPAEVVNAVPVPRWGRPDPNRICTSHVERQNLTMRMQIRRLTRLTLSFSKRWENLKAALALHFAWYNFCRVHSSLRVTPAMEAGITNHVWNLDVPMA